MAAPPLPAQSNDTRPRITAHGQQGETNYPRAVATFLGLEPSRRRPDNRVSYGCPDLDRLSD